jgi:putative hydrolase of the HAD superfamily
MVLQKYKEEKLKMLSCMIIFILSQTLIWLGLKKPNPIIFEYALDLAKANKENSIMIGDSLDADVQGALDMGLDAIFFNTDKVQVERNKTSQSFIRIKKYL